MDPAETEENTLWVKETYEALASHFSGGRYVNYLSDDEKSDAVRSSYGVVYDRLVDVKRRYDPDNLFHLNQNIPPEG
jgi:FAD/FMN-containing dehydrogenase